MESGVEEGKEGSRERERTVLYHKIQTSHGFPGHSQQLFILLGRIDPPLAISR